jgi:hypothetical protein
MEQKSMMRRKIVMDKKLKRGIVVFTPTHGYGVICGTHRDDTYDVRLKTSGKVVRRHISQCLVLEPQSEYLAFNLIKDGAKTKVWSVVAQRSPAKTLARIGWYAPWRKYVFIPFGQPIFDQNCLNEITAFLGKVNLEHKIKLKEKKNDND